MSNISKIFPPYKDYLDVCAAISLIQESYDLNTTDLAKGNILMKNVSSQFIFRKKPFFSNFPNDFVLSISMRCLPIQSGLKMGKIVQ